MSEALLYLHIPKTAGSAVTEFLRSNYSSAQTADITPPDYLEAQRALRERDEHAKRDIRLVTGHFSYGLHASLPQPSRYYTILRHPIDRLVSLYFFTRSDPSHPRYESARSMSLVEYALSGIHPEIENCQTKMLSGREETDFLTGTEPCAEIDLERAMANIESSFVGCGIFEDLPRSLYLLSRSMAWRYGGLPTRNVTRERVSVSQLSFQEREALASVNQYDLRLYEYVRTRHARDFAALEWPAKLRWRALAFLRQVGG